MFLRRVFATLPVLLAVSCTTTPTAPEAEVDAKATASQAPSGTAIPFSVEAGPLAFAVRSMGERYREGVVLMAGVDGVNMPARRFESATADAVLRWIAETAGLQRTDNDGYSFLYPDTYGVLNAVSLEDDLPAAFDELRAAVAFGTATPLFDALAFLSETLELAIVADQAVAESPLGEVALDVSPLPVILEALLKSARVPPDAFEVDATNEYILIRSVANPAQRTLLLNEDRLRANERAMLGRRVNVRLPAPSNDPDVMIGRFGARPLGELLPELSRQLGVPVRAAEGVETLPVNPMVLPNVTVRTALALIIAQWPVDAFGYRVDANGVLIHAVAP